MNGYTKNLKFCQSALKHMAIMLQDVPEDGQDILDETFINCMLAPTLRTIHEITETHFSDKGEA